MKRSVSHPDSSSTKRACTSKESAPDTVPTSTINGSISETDPVPPPNISPESGPLASTSGSQRRS